MNIKHLEINDDENLFFQILDSVEKDSNKTFRRIARTAKDDDNFYFTVITSDYCLLEIKLTLLDYMRSINGLPAFECTVEVF